MKNFIKKNIDFCTFLALFCVIFALIFTVFLPIFSKNGVVFAQTGSSYIVLDAKDNSVIDGENIHMKLENASTTKIVTLIVALQNIPDINAYVNIDKRAVGIEGSSIYLKEKQRWKIKDLLYGMMLRSGNDSAVQIAISTCGSVEKFVEKMNELVLKLGLKNTCFKNPSGLSENGHFVSAYDLAVLTSYGYSLPNFETIVSSKYHTTDVVFDGEKEEKYTFKNKNKLLFSVDGACGVKTGYTKKSGRCFVGSVKRANLRLIYVCLNKADMWTHSASSLENGFSKYEKIQIAKEGDVAGYVYSDIQKDFVKLFFKEDLSLYFKDFDKNMLSFKIEKSDFVSEKEEKTKTVSGFLKVYYSNSLIFEVEVCNNFIENYKE